MYEYVANLLKREKLRPSTKWDNFFDGFLPPQLTKFLEGLTHCQEAKISLYIHRVTAPHIGSSYA